MAMISPWMDNGTLLQYINRNPTVDRHSLCVGIADGVVYLHYNGAVHGDIKSANVLISREGVPKLADFGCTQLKSCTVGFTTTTSAPQISIRWTAPEMLDEGPTFQTQEADIYALGMTILEAVTGELPFNDLSDRQLYMNVVIKHQIPRRPTNLLSFNESEGDQIWSIMEDTWKRDPLARPTSMSIRNRLKSLLQREPNLDLPMPHKTHEAVESNSTEMYFFLISSNIFAFDGAQVISRVDEGDKFVLVDSYGPNPPALETLFYIEETALLFDRHGGLWYNLNGQWVEYSIYPSLALAKLGRSQCLEEEQAASPSPRNLFSQAASVSSLSAIPPSSPLPDATMASHLDDAISPVFPKPSHPLDGQGLPVGYDVDSLSPPSSTIAMPALSPRRSTSSLEGVNGPPHPPIQPMGLKQTIVYVSHGTSYNLGIPVSGLSDGQAIRKRILSRLRISKHLRPNYTIHLAGFSYVPNELDDGELLKECLQCSSDQKRILRLFVRDKRTALGPVGDITAEAHRRSRREKLGLLVAAHQTRHNQFIT
ncbi:Ephrin type-A receptor 10 [Ceratobasidium sp. AG-Ba]|nr:Ephrin type-A receptor 10 [Ceratobasidium sp. AG-Ba]